MLQFRIQHCKIMEKGNEKGGGTGGAKEKKGTKKRKIMF